MKYITTILILILIGLGAMAQEAMSLEQCRTKAIGHNKELKMANYQKAAAESNQKAARTAYFPSLSAGADIMYLPNMEGIEMDGGFLPTAESEEAALAGNFSGTSNVWSPGMSMELDNISVVMGNVSLTQPIYAGGRIQNSNKQADLAVNIYKQNYNLKYSEVIERTDQAYWTIASVKANVYLAEKYIAMLTELEEQMTDMYKLGLVPASEKLKVTVQKNQAELNLLKARNGLRLAKINLNQIMGNELQTEINIDDSLKQDIQLISFDQGIQRAYANRSELGILQNQVSIAKYDKKIALADYLPSVGVSASYGTNYVSNYMEDLSFNSQIAGQISIPLFSWGQGKHKQEAAQMRIREAETNLNNTRELINLEVQSVRIEIEEAYQSILIARKNVDEAKESLSETQASFDAGLNTTTDLLNSQAQWQNAQTQLISSLADYEVLKTKWARVTGTLKQEVRL